MPFASPAQKKLVYYKAAQGEAWARKFLRDMGIKDLPPLKRRGHKRRGRGRVHGR